MRTHPDANAASDSSAPDSLAKAFGEQHPLRVHVRDGNCRETNAGAYQQIEIIY
jgi:hypothetical protein